ncbi:MAG: Hsp70 family protein, partial [Lachnospiraceae bacterium]|nr:Hsp70 family protein [Lachnospiraceae bacterium]
VSNELDEEISRVVISVPAYFDDAQRRATVAAGEQAGLQVERIINEPTAAALSYGLSHLEEESHILVYDLGGGTFDVTLLEMFGGVLEVKASNGDNQLGGKDFDEALIDMLIDRFREKNDVDLRKDTHAMVRLKEEAEKCKIVLSESEAFRVMIPMISQKNGKPISLDEEITRQEFEEKTAHLIERTHRAIDTVIADGSLTWDEVDQIILVGGSTRMPVVQQDIEKYTGIKPQRAVDPDFAVAEGAAIQAGIIGGEISEEKSVIITDVNPFTLGIKSASDTGYNVMSVIMPRNITIPTSRTERFSTHADNQTAVDVEVFQGESSVATDNHYLGSFVLDGIPRKRAGKEKIDVEFSYDQNGILNVSATVISNGRSASSTINLVESGHATGQSGMDAFDWKSAPLADDYRAIMRKAQKYIRNAKEEGEVGSEIEDLEDFVFELAKAIVENDSRAAESYENRINHFFVFHDLSESNFMEMLRKHLMDNLGLDEDLDDDEYEDLDDEDWDEDDD